MNFKQHLELEGRHAFLGGSKWHWINYDEDKLRVIYDSYNAAQRGTELHAFAAKCIELGVKLPKTSMTLNMFVNDAIGYRMKPEQPLYYSDNCFGTADAISFRRNLLRIHDLKTGVIPAHMEQLMIYDAMFCLEYSVDPYDIQIENRIYQNNAIVVHTPEPIVIKQITDKIIEFDKLLEEIKMGE